MRELPDDWHAPIRDLQEKVWREHPERERLEEFWRERDDDGERVWEQVLEPEPGNPDWTQLVLVNRHEARSERVGRWPTKVVEDAQRDAEAIVDEHHLDD
jgi:hypothetical protein